MNQNYFANKLQNDALLKFGWVVLSGDAGSKMPAEIKTVEISSDDESSAAKNWLAYLPGKAEAKTVAWNDPHTDKNTDTTLTNAGWKVVDANETRSIYVKTK